MTRPKVQYQCNACGAQFPKWAGQCPDCEAWNTLEEVAAINIGRHAGSRGRQPDMHVVGDAAGVQTLDSVETETEVRMPTGTGEFDRVLGGGLVRGSIVLIGGDPGIGKSTLLLQTVANLAAKGTPCLYVTAEESAQQVALRGKRLGLKLADLKISTQNQLEDILATSQNEKPAVLVIDSIQTVFSDVLQSAPGAVAQVRECAAQLVRYAKQTGTAVFLVGHVTKEGTLAGPRVLEHMVDGVLYFEGDSGSRFRVIRAVKNRYGAVNELGVFAMTDKGLKEVGNPSAIFLSRHEQPVAGSVVMVTREGSRPLLVEVQALVDSSSSGNPRRVILGLEQNRLAMLLAVMHRHGGIATYDQDVFVNVVGGVRVTETAADLPIVLAALSSLRDQPLPQELVAFGEVGLAGEIRPVLNGPERLKEAAKHGFKRAIVPQANKPKQKIEGLEVTGVSRLNEALQVIIQG
ncbi:MAG: DNA repair protein RadA [Gammaproteobacteria bacterium]|nr:DNA repair protein RadA [Gammaproteobacteria bacterium]